MTNIALYGLGTETKKLISNKNIKATIVGLLDSFQSDGTIWGLPIIKLEDCISLGVNKIIVVARPGSCKAIAHRIGSFCNENGIELEDYRGNNLLEKKKVVYNLSNLAPLFINDIKKQIYEHDIISFDLFDTLVTRNVLNPTDIYSLMNQQLVKIGVEIDDFEDRRLEAELILTKERAPKLVDIYRYVLEHIDGNCKFTPNELADLEWEIDQKLLIPRLKVCELIRDAIENGKRIQIITDSYYSSEQIVLLLNRFNITGYERVFVSSEYGIGKTQGLFSVVQNILGEGKYLHVGDDKLADEESPAQVGMDSFLIYSGREMFEATGDLGLEEYIAELPERIQLGMFVARLFNNPFIFENNPSAELVVERSEDVAYLFMAPILTDFVLWLYRFVVSNDVDRVLFAARDGYLVQKMFEMLPECCNTTYFLTSRLAAIRAGIENEDDLIYVQDMKFSGGIRQQLKDRFGILIEDKLEKDRSLLDYFSKIQSLAITKKENYRRYYNSLNIAPNEKIVFFDFVARGTCQLFVEKILGKKFKGIYFMQNDVELMKQWKMDISTYYDTSLKDNEIYEDYYLLEPILSSSLPTLAEFDIHGAPVYLEETRTEEQIRIFDAMQREILEYFSSYIVLDLNLNIASRTLSEKMLNMIHHFKVGNDYKGLEVEDLFFNRRTEVSSLI